MPLSRDEIRARLDEADRLNPDLNGGVGGEAYLEAMRGLLPHAEALGEPDLLMDVRLGYTWALLKSDLSADEVFREVLPVLRRCLLDLHAHPGRYRDLLADDLWNQVLNVCSVYIRLFPAPARLLHRLLDELERYCPSSRPWTRYAIDHYRMELFARQGDHEAVERLWVRLRAKGLPRDHFILPGWAGCLAVMWQRLGRDDRALEAMAPLLTGQIETSDGDDHSDALILPYLRTGRFDEAVEAHRRHYARPGMKLEGLAAHLQFCALTGNEERGMEVLQRNVGLLLTRSSEGEWTWTAAAAVLLCRRVMERDLDRRWCRTCECADEECYHDAVMSYADLAGRLYWQVVELSLALDEKDGGTSMSERTTAIMFAEPVVEHLSLPEGRGGAPRPEPHLPADADLAAELERVTGLDTWPRFVRTQRILQTAMVRDETGPQPDIRLALLDQLTSPELRAEIRGSQQSFGALSDLARWAAGTGPERVGADRLDRMWRAVPVVLNDVLTFPAVHAAQIRGLLRTLEPLCRPGTDDLHHLRWFTVELEVRRGDLDAARAAWAAFEALPPADAHRTREAVLRRALWWLDLRWDEGVREAVAALASGDDREDYLLPVLLRAGEEDRARELHERTYPTVREAPEVAAHLEFCARTGAFERGRELIRRNLDLYHTTRDDTECSIDLLRAYGAGIAFTERLVEAGLDEEWTWPAHECCGAEEGWTYARFAESCRVEARLFATRWDMLMGAGAEAGAGQGPTGRLCLPPPRATGRSRDLTGE